MSADYGTVDTLISSFLPSADDADRDTLAQMLAAAYRTIDSRTRRQPFAFSPAPTEATEQTFYGTDSPVLLLPDFVAGSISAVTGPSGYMPPGWAEWQRRDETTGAYRRGLHTATSAAEGGILDARLVWKKGAPFKVTARWGFEQTPAEITQAGYLLVRHWWTQNPGNLSGPTGDLRPYTQERGFPKMIDELIAPYRLPDALAEEEGGEIERGELLDADVMPWRGEGPGGWGRF